MKGLPVHWFSTGRWQHVAVSLFLTFFFFCNAGKRSTCHGLASWEPVLGRHTSTPRRPVGQEGGGTEHLGWVVPS